MNSTPFVRQYGILLTNGVLFICVLPEIFASYLFFLFFRRSDQRFIARVMAMQIGKKGVNGPAQNTRQVDAMTDAHVQPNIADSRYPPHTGE